MLVSWGVRTHGLTDGQVVTLVVGLGMELRSRHAAGSSYGPIHPTHVRVDAARRPWLVDVVTPPGWTPHDDWVSLLRLGRVVAAGPWGSELSAAARGREGDELLRWALTQVDPEPLPAWAFPAPATVSERTSPRPGARRERWRVLVRSWGPGR